MAVKLGTITRDGKADVFSYDEDDMVLDPLLEKHLAHFGIKVGECEKTDKSMVEMEIDMNARIGEWVQACATLGTKQDRTAQSWQHLLHELFDASSLHNPRVGKLLPW